MASHCQSQPPVHRCQDDYEPPEPADAVDDEAKLPPEPHRAQRDYDFLERPSEDYFCPVTLELLLEPHQTACCGHHLSHDAAARLQREGKPCPVCKEPKLTTMADKFFNRKVKELKARCPRKESGCEWVGEVGSLDQHDRACPKRPWQCEYCQERGLYEIQEKHMFTCTHYPTPCPNKCDVGTVARCKLDEHIAVCALQLVECEFSHAGCKVTVQRKEMARHVEEEAQQHLLTATLFNLSFTREMRAEMKEMQKNIKEMKEKIVRMEAQLQAKVEGTSTLKKMEAQITQLQRQATNVEACVLNTLGFDFTLSDYDPSGIDWFSKPFCVPSCDQYMFQLNIDNDTAGNRYVRAYLYPTNGVNDDNLPWPITVRGRLILLNQLEDKNHHSLDFSTKLSKSSRNDYRCISESFIPTKDLTHNTQRGTRYLKYGNLCFRLHLKVSS